MNELKSKSLAQIVNQNHRAAWVFEKYHLDFCCKGKRSFLQACSEQQLLADQVLAELENLSTPDISVDKIQFDEMTLTQLIEYILLTHHAYVNRELPQIFGYLQKVSSKHGERHPELIKIFQLFAAVKEELENHMKKEETVLFPRIKEMEKHLLKEEAGQINLNITYLQSPITIMEQEHDHAGTLMNEIRLLTDNYTPPSDACTTYKLSFASLQAFELDLHQHIHLENNILFPKAIKVFKKSKESVLN
jgi:regulator of cell morphogenesis and NO signaling